ncbi:MAG: protoheme IX farnesyltransferase [Armatimonadetes bacterium]|nr:protoheme IX farnesyltransferase [Armatimonadota bacterium]
MDRLRRLATITAVLTYLLVMLGGLVRATGAGLACPDWPLCHGRILPPLETPVLIEWTHRLVASVVGLFTVATAWAARSQRKAAPRVARLAWLAVVLLIAQVLLGALTVRLHLAAGVVVAHLALGLAFLTTITLIVLAADDARVRPSPGNAEPPSAPRSSFRFGHLAVLAAVGVFGASLLGGYVGSSGAALACPDWPLCYGRLVPPLRGPILVQFIHRMAALTVGLLILVTTLRASRAQRHHPGVGPVARAALVLLAVQVLLGGLNVSLRIPAAVTTIHLGVAAALLVLLVILAFRAWQPPVVAGGETAGGVAYAAATPDAGAVLRAWGRAAADYVHLTKPRIIVLLLATAYAAMWMAARGAPDPVLALLTLLGGALAAGGANAINCYVDRDIDGVMARTRTRPLPAGRVPPGRALAFGIALGVASFLLMAAWVNVLSAVLAQLALLFYVGVYTLWLKRSTPLNIVIGGAAGAVPPMVGWAAVTGRLDLTAVLLFGIIFLWTPPHFWALALVRVEDYRRAGVPMLPVVKGDNAARRQILAYSGVLVLFTLVLTPLGLMGWLYLGAAVVLGAGFIALAAQVRRDTSHRAAWRLFGYSIVYLALLFFAMAFDRSLG